LGITDDFGATLAQLNYSGMLLANSVLEQDEDSYEDDQSNNNQDNRRKASNIEFRPFNEWKQAKTWTYSFKNGESVECLAMGSGWCCCLTNFGYIRVFTHGGIQKQILCQGAAVVSMAGYENLLAVVYHSGPSVYGQQAMRVKTINMSHRDYTILSDVDFPVSR
jgi:chromosome transmission fidelity protein 4